MGVGGGEVGKVKKVTKWQALTETSTIWGPWHACSPEPGHFSYLFGNVFPNYFCNAHLLRKHRNIYKIRDDGSHFPSIFDKVIPCCRYMTAISGVNQHGGVKGVTY